MRGKTIRLTDSMWELLQEEADAEGVSLAQFVREAAIIRAIAQRTRRGELDPSLEAIAAAVERLRD